MYKISLTVSKLAKRDKCAVCDLSADRFCPILDAQICSISCVELSGWSDDVMENDIPVNLEFLEAVREFSSGSHATENDARIAELCEKCQWHWRDE